MSKISLNKARGGKDLSIINDNFSKIEDEFQDKVLYRVAVDGEPNRMETNLDMNGHAIFNCPSIRHGTGGGGGASNASELFFDNTGTTIGSTDVQGAIVELYESVDSTSRVILSSDSSIFHIDADGEHSPSEINFTASRVFLKGDIVFTCDGGVLTEVTDTTATLVFEDMTADSAIVTATIVQDGYTYASSWLVAKVLDGQNGQNGQDGTGVTTYTWLKYGTSSSGANLSDSPDGMTYIGLAYNKTTPVESTIPSDYAWSLLKGADGVNGTDGTDGLPGAPGADGITTYTWIKYADVFDGTGMYDTPNSNTMYIGIAVNKTVQAEGTDKTAYTWSKFKGDQGVPGTNGSDGVGTRGAGSYYAVGSSWTDAAANAATPGNNVVDDMVTISDGTFTTTKRWDGSAWNVPGALFDGNLFVTGSIGASKINTNGLTIRDSVGNVILDAGGLRSGYSAPGTLNSDLTSSISSAQSTASNALSNAASAQNTADTASSTASSAQGTASTALTNAGSAQIAADNAQGTASTALSTANSAFNTINDPTTGLSSRLRKNADDVLGGILSVNTVSAPSGFRAGTLTWDTAGNRTGGYGVALTPKGLVGYNSAGTLTFSIDATTGAAAYYGPLSASSITTGTLSVDRIADGSIVDAWFFQTYGGSLFEGVTVYDTPTQVISIGVGPTPVTTTWRGEVNFTGMLRLDPYGIDVVTVTLNLEYSADNGATWAIYKHTEVSIPPYGSNYSVPVSVACWWSYFLQGTVNMWRVTASSEAGVGCYVEGLLTAKIYKK